MQNVIEVGDRLTSDQGELGVNITKVTIGRYGLLILGIGELEGKECSCYAPFELPALEDDSDLNNWHGWYRMSTYLPSGKRIGILSLSPPEPLDDIEYYDSKWERTLETIKLDKIVEPMQSRPFVEQSRPDVL